MLKIKLEHSDMYEYFNWIQWDFIETFPVIKKEDNMFSLFMRELDFYV